MDTNETNRNGPDDERTGETPESEESPALGPFVLAVGECAELLARIRERLDDHLGVFPDDVTWARVADADRLLHLLRHAAFVAGVGGEPLP